MENSNSKVSFGLSLESIGFVTWLVFLILKLCNLNNPDFEWLTWFWVWFPFWLPLAIDALILVVCGIVFLVAVNSD